MAIAGRVAIVPKGEWSQSVTYDKLDLVTHNGNTFIAYKSSVGVTPVDGDTWMLVMQGIDPQDIDNIINGTTPVGNANKLNGLTAEEFVRSAVLSKVTASTTIAETIQSFIDSGINQGKFQASGCSDLPSTDWAYGIEFKVCMGDDYEITAVKRLQGVYRRQYSSSQKAWLTGWSKASDGGNADTVDGIQGSSIVAYKPAGLNTPDITHANIPAEGGVWLTAVSGLTGLPDGWADSRHAVARLYNGNPAYSLDFLSSYGYQKLAWRMGKEWKEILDTNNMKNHVLPLTGGTLSGTLKTYSKGHMNGLQVYRDDSGMSGVQFLNADGVLGWLGMHPSTGYLYHLYGDNSTNGFVHDTANKPTGSYTGNGSAAARTINVGGIGGVLQVYSANTIGFVTHNGGYVIKLNTKEIVYFSESELNFQNGILTIKTTADAINVSGGSYSYYLP